MHFGSVPGLGPERGHRLKEVGPDMLQLVETIELLPGSTRLITLISHQTPYPRILLFYMGIGILLVRTGTSEGDTLLVVDLMINEFSPIV